MVGVAEERFVKDRVVHFDEVKIEVWWLEGQDGVDKAVVVEVVEQMGGDQGDFGVEDVVEDGLEGVSRALGQVGVVEGQWREYGYLLVVKEPSVCVVVGVVSVFAVTHCPLGARGDIFPVLGVVWGVHDRGDELGGSVL